MKIFKLINTGFMVLAVNYCNSQVTNQGEFVINEFNQVIFDGDFFNESTGEFYNNGELIIPYNIDNKGIIDFTNSGIIKLVGTKPQSLFTELSTGYTSFYDLYLDNSNNLNSSNEFSIHNNLNFISGHIFNDAPVIFEHKAFSKNENNSAYIKGTVRRIGNNSFDFPIGDNLIDYNNNLIYSGTTSNSNIDATYKLQSTLSFDHNMKDSEVRAINELEYFEIINNQNNNDNKYASIGFKILNSNISNNVLNNQFGTVLSIVQFDFEKNKWINIGGDIENNIITKHDVNLTSGIYTLGRVYDEKQALKDLLVFNAVSKSQNNKNDTLFIRGIENFPNNHLTIYNRYGNEIYSKYNYQNENGWDGYYQNKALPSGTYYYVLNITTPSGEKVQKKSFLQLN